LKVLIAITSCARDRAAQQAIRDTWIKDIPEGVDYRFFLGQPTAADAKPDEVFLDVSDEYLKLVDKTKALLDWALNRTYEFIYKADVDTLVCPANLLSSGYESHNYMGGLYSAPDIRFASGGSGYWLSAKAARCVVDKITTDLYEDTFVAKTCYASGFSLHGHPQYKFAPGSPLTKNTVSYHLSSVYGWRQDPGASPYTADKMYKAYAQFKAL